jgi:hypothetical protein
LGFSKWTVFTEIHVFLLKIYASEEDYDIRWCR